MHIFFSGIGGTAIGPLALIAKQAGYEVSGSDKQNSKYIKDISIGQSYQDIQELHSKNSIDWYVYSSAVAIENPDADEFRFTREMGIKTSKRDELINKIVSDKNLKMLAVAGTHGKTTTTAMLIWLFKSLNQPISYSVGAKINFGEMGQYQEESKYFIYEADEFDRNFLAFEPFETLITGVTWDHHEVFPTFSNIKLKGLYNRLDAYLAVNCFTGITGKSTHEAIDVINNFPGSSRRMEEIATNLYSDYAHTPEKIKGAMSIAREMADENNQKLVVVYEPLTNRRQHFMKDEYKDCFLGVDKLYWIPSYLAREDPDQAILTPKELISHINNPEIAEAKEMDHELLQNIKENLENNNLVVCLSGGGGKSLDEWLRDNF